MSLASYRLVAILFLVSLASAGRAEGFVLGAGIDADSENGRAATVFGDFGIGDNTWLSASASAYETSGPLGRRNTLYADVALDHLFDPFGVRVGASYWGNSDILDSADLKASFYYRSESMMLSADYERRDFDFVVLADFPTLRRTAEFSANGIGITSRLPLGEDTSLHIGGISYDYSRNIRVQPDIDVLRFLSSSRLSMINSLIDYRVSAGVEYRFGLRGVDLSVGRWRTAVDGGTVDSYSIGFLTPFTDRLDAEMRFSIDESEYFGRTAAMSIYLYYFGGT